MTDSSLCINLVSIHWKLANEPGDLNRAGKIIAIVVARPQNHPESLCLLVPRGLFHSQVARRGGTGVPRVNHAQDARATTRLTQYQPSIQVSVTSGIEYHLVRISRL